MREIPAEMNRAWKSGQFVGRDRPYVALVLRQPRMRLHSSSQPAPRQQSLAPSGIPFRGGWGERRSVAQQYASYLWGDSVKPVLLPNIKSFSWSRGVSQDVGQATIELWNTNPYPFGAEVQGDPLRSGYFSYNYGGMQHSSRWGHLKNEWFGKLVPDMLIESYEGYGHSEGVAPERDGLLLQTGVWRIRDVEMTAGDRVMRITCEDLGSLLTEQIAFPPVVPNDWYPLSFGPIPDPIRTDTVVPGGNVGIRITKTSNLPWNNDRPMFGWAKENVLDNNGHSAWISVGNVHPSRGFAYEYIEFALNQPGFVSEVTFSTVNKGYTAYLSVSTDNMRSWHGTEVIGWRSENIGRNGGNIPFVQSQPVGSEDTHSFAVNMDGVTHFRVTLGNLQYFGQFPGYKYRGAFREIAARGGPRTVTTFTELVPKTAEAGSHAGIAKDWTDVIKMCLAWAGWYWPRGSRRMLSDGTVRITSPTQPDQVLASDGRVWGDVEVAGTMGPAGYKNLAKQPLRQVIQGVLDVLGHVFFIDETGAAIVRSPNLFTVGNWYRSLTGQTVRTEQVTPLDEATCIIDIRTRISGRNIRDRISVGNPMNVQEGDKSGGVSASVAGWNPNPTGLRRHALWLDQGFATENEALVMADMIAVRGAFTYRTSEITITANPGIQVDDQVRVYERNTSEGYLHYVDAISSEMDCTTGQWTYTLTTHWLGSDPEGVWALNKRMLTQPTRELTFRNAGQKFRMARNLKGGS